MICLSYYLLCFLFNKIREKGGKDFAGKCGGGGVSQTMYACVNKCKNNKMKGEKLIK
jgi:hypothetical protein